jgi:RNA polymerase sigma factor (sigma-70 family)
MSADSVSNTRLSLLARLQQQPDDQGAWAEFVDRYAPRILGWCRQRQLQDADARDVTQNVLLKLAAKMRSFRYDASGSFRAWLKTVTHHAWSDYVTARQRPGLGSGSPQVEELLREVTAGEELSAHLKDEFDQEVLEESRLRVQGRVDARTWEAFRLTALEGRSGAEAAAELGMTVAAVFKAKSRVLKMLQDEVRELEGSVTQ